MKMIEELVASLTEAKEHYYNSGVPLLSDMEFDSMETRLRTLDPANSYFTGVGSPVRGVKCKLPYTMGSLDEIYPEDVTWASNELILYTITEKLDGVSVSVVYDANGKLQIAYTRGDGYYGFDITRHVKSIKNFPKEIQPTGKTFAIRAEIIISKKNFDICKSKGDDYKNSRNYVSGMINNQSASDAFYDYVDIIVYELLTKSDQYTTKEHELNHLLQLGFKIPQYSTYYGTTNSDTLNAIFESYLETSPYELDGLVIEYGNYKDRKVTDGLNPSHARKYKPQKKDNIVETEVLYIEWNASKWGYLKPRVRIKPVDIAGVTITWASAFNAKYVVDNKIGPGTKILITRSGDVIPDIVKVVESTEAQMPNCEYQWNKSNVDIEIVEENDNVEILKIVNFFTSLDVAGLKIGSVTALYEEGLEDVVSFIKAPKEFLVQILGNKNGTKIWTDIKKKLNPVKMHVLAGSAQQFFGRGIGVRRFEEIVKRFPNPSDWIIDNLVTIEGVGNEIAPIIESGVPKFENFLENISGYYQIDTSTTTQQSSGEYSNLNVVFTEVRDKDMEEAITSKGGKVSSGVSKKTTLVIANTLSTDTSKTKKAKELGINIIDYSEACVIFKGIEKASNPEENLSSIEKLFV